ncbi:DUF1476 family protein [Sinorhizobium medicae]|nr:DUF1476 family protein [Sinorhizobium medicae]
MVRRNKLVGIWAAEGLGLVGECAKAYSDDLAMATFDLEGSDVLSKIREDFNAAGVAHSDDQILCVMSQSWLEASDKRQTKRADASDTATVQIARNLQLK